MTLANGVPIESVSKMLGHTSLRTTGWRSGQIYAKVVEQKLSSDMQALKGKLGQGQLSEGKYDRNQQSSS